MISNNILMTSLIESKSSSVDILTWLMMIHYVILLFKLTIWLNHIFSLRLHRVKSYSPQDYTQKIEIMHIEQGKLSVKNAQLCATLCVYINKKEPSPCISSIFVIKKGEHPKRSSFTKSSHLTEFYIPLYTSYLHFNNTTHH